MARKQSQGRDHTLATLILAHGACESRVTAGERSCRKQFSFKYLGIEAQGRTKILKINYRNTRQILQTASLIAADLLNAALHEGHAWGDMAVICRRHELDECAQALSRLQLPHQVCKSAGKPDSV